MEDRGSKALGKPIEAHTKGNKENRPLYTIGIVAELIGVSEQTLRNYEKQGLIKPARRNKNRFYSDNDIKWINCLRDLLYNKKISLVGIKKLLNYAPCWELTDCPEEIKEICSAHINRTKPCWELNTMKCKNKKGNLCGDCIVYLSKSKGKSIT